jgi:hypothetical protein
MYKALGLSSEEVFEVGKLKNVQAFTSHYLRLGASAKAGERVTSLVHNQSHIGSSDPTDMTSTPGRVPDQGGMVMEGGEQNQYETRFLPAAIGYVLFLLRWGLLVLHRFRGRQLADVALLFNEK